MATAARKKKDPFNRVVLASVPLGDDVVARLSTLTVAGVEMIEVSEFIPSAQQYGRGITLPVEKWWEMVDSAAMANVSTDG